jgi:hypothetical protein
VGRGWGRHFNDDMLHPIGEEYGKKGLTEEGDCESGDVDGRELVVEDDGPEEDGRCLFEDASNGAG